MSSSTQNEYILPSTLVILSTSDMQGNITSYNAGFRDASGYSDGELQGKPHSLLRHPDMPKEAFEDLWKTLQAGLPWYGIVKNKRKNGDHYWVSANAAPIVHNGQVTGYVSVRYPATREQISFAQSLYADIKSGRKPMPWTKLTQGKESLFNALSMVALTTSLGVLSTGILTSPLLTGLMTAFGLAGLAYLAKQLYRKDHLSPEIQKGIENICNAHCEQPIMDSSSLGFQFNLIRSRVAEGMAKNYDAVREAQVMVQALNAASSNIMIADHDFTIVSTNNALTRFFTEKESALKQVLPLFSADKVVGSNMDIFHKNPSHQRHLLSNITKPVQSELTLPNLVIRLTVIPIDMNATRLGYVVEWLDRTIEATVITELATVFSSVKDGDFTHRINAQAAGIYQEIKQDVNIAMDTVQQALDAISAAVASQAKGDLTQALPSNTFKGQLHDLKNAFNYSTKKIKELVERATETSAIVSDAAYQVSLGAADLSGRVQEQAAALEQTSATMHEIASAVQMNTENAHKVANLANQVQHQAGSGAEVMQQTITAMQSIKESSTQISDIVSIIDGIAFQTNLLALNAAVEAARAGEHGRGFAVVAGEVRGLAQKSAEAAKNIKTLITDSVSRIEAGTQLADKSGEMLNGITDSIANVAKMVESIATASSEQTTGISHVHKAIADIDQITQENAALVEETTAAAESLNNEANNLKENMAFFKTRK
jgi:methyl-accepting chemotaxis protein